MTALIDAALLARRDRLVTALYDQPALRDKLSLAEITAAVDTALDTVGLPALLTTIVAAQAVADAIADTIPTPPSAVTTALGGYATGAGGVNDDYNIFEP